MVQNIIKKIKKVTIIDIVGIVLFLVVFFPSFIYKWYLKISKKELWLLCETKNTARDNGFVFYEYLKKSHPEIKSYYAINKRSSDYKKVKNYGNIVEWGSLKHYFLYMSATKNISSHKEGNPNHALFTILHIYLNLYNNRVFLQHGILFNELKMFYKKNAKFKIFITGAKPEYDYVKEKYGYDNEVRYTGLARFDNLHDYIKNQNIILFIPTWRKWLENKDDFKKSNYYKTIISFINSPELEKLLEANSKYLYFYPHLSSQKYMNLYKTRNKRVKIFDINNCDIQELLKEGSLLITDFSSISADFAYMHKPIIYYQFDRKEFYSKHHVAISSYFDLDVDSFGDVVFYEGALIEKIEYYIRNNMCEEKKYAKKINEFFVLYDKNNCNRIFNEIIYMENE